MPATDGWIPATGLSGLAVRSAPLPSVIAMPAPLPSRQQAPKATAGVARRAKIWELDGHFHCSIIGTCLSAAELKNLLAKLDQAAMGVSDHELHGLAVSLAGRHDKAAKLLNKALDKRHRLAIAQFDRAKTEAELAAAWAAALQQGEIPGAYWAALTHPAATKELIRRIFGEVHMLSHLVGAANRADIRRLSRLEAEMAALQEKFRRQQDQLRDAVVSRDEKIRELCGLLARSEAGPTAASASGENQVLEAVIADLERRLGAEARRRGALAERLERSLADLAGERGKRAAAESRALDLEGELAALEAGLGESTGPDVASANSPLRLAGLTLLYVGGRPRQVGSAKLVAEKAGAVFLHHDGGVEASGALLAGMVSRADVALFPVDCVSHEAALAVKRLCRQSAKPFLPLRSSGLGSFLAALGVTASAGREEART
ncbi:MAG TPA: DUF2325 domain-containing protein [Candidatus Udaeobacter sp.]|nr:DUF2325 domain-containing protein [Candidatus Udaeobacter sp.]